MGEKAPNTTNNIHYFWENKKGNLYLLWLYPSLSERLNETFQRLLYYSKSRIIFSPVLMSEFYAWWCTRRPTGVFRFSGELLHHQTPAHTTTLLQRRFGTTSGEREGRKIICAERTFFLSARRPFYNQTLSTYSNQTADLKRGHKKVIDCQICDLVNLPRPR